MIYRHTQSAFKFSKLTTETLQQEVKYDQTRRQWCLSGAFIVNFEHISHLLPVFLLLTLNM